MGVIIDGNDNWNHNNECSERKLEGQEWSYGPICQFENIESKCFFPYKFISISGTTPNMVP